MSNNIQTFEVQVRVKRKGSRRFSPRMGMYVDDSDIRMFHIEAGKPKQAKRKAEKHGRVLSCRKVSASQVIERMAVITEAQLVGIQMTNPYLDAVAMDELIWKRKNKRAERIRNRGRDGNNH